MCKTTILSISQQGELILTQEIKLEDEGSTLIQQEVLINYVGEEAIIRVASHDEQTVEPLAIYKSKSLTLP